MVKHPPGYSSQMPVLLTSCSHVGNRASGAIWCAFYALVLWVRIVIKNLPGLLHYIDDAFSFNLDEDLEFYSPYDQYYPKKQAALLWLFDEIGIPHEKRKQEFGQSLTIIGLDISLDSMSITMPDDKCVKLVEDILDFIGKKS